MYFDNFPVGTPVALVEHSYVNMGYVVTKHDKIKIVVKHSETGFERTFSVKTGQEKYSSGWMNNYSLSIVTIEKAIAILENQKREIQQRKFWEEIRAIAGQYNPNLNALEAKIAEYKSQNFANNA